MRKFTIKDAIVKALLLSKKPLSSKEIYDRIIELKLFHFKAKNPTGIVNSELRKSCVGIDLKKSKAVKEFEINNEGKYSLKK